MTTEELRTKQAMEEFAIEPGDSQEEILAKGIAGAIAKVVRPLVRRIAALERERRSAMDADGLSDAILGAIDRECDPLETRIKALEARTKAIEGGGIRYRGVHDVTTSYQPGDVVTSGGSMWVCREAIIGARPGEGSAAWTLAVKRGKDRKEVRQ